MVKYENHCCDCAAPGYPCLGSLCSRRRVEVHYCDNCGCELEKININEDTGDELCDECLAEQNETED